jgi:hypothetical protein
MLRDKKQGKLMVGLDLSQSTRFSLLLGVVYVFFPAFITVFSGGHRVMQLIASSTLVQISSIYNGLTHNF